MNNNLLNTPFYSLNKLSDDLGIDLWVKRDDLIPFFLGGNKVRKNIHFLEKGLSKNCSIITNGGSESNHARVVALLGAQIGCDVHLVLHGEKPLDHKFSGNSFFYRSAGAKLYYVDSHEIGTTINNIKNMVNQTGKFPLVIPGGAHSAEGAEAYCQAINELPFEPDYIFHASGTGGTQAGLLRGVVEKKWKTEVFGISVARTQARGIEEIQKLLPENFPIEKIIFLDNYRFGGYEHFNSDLIHLVQDVLKREGLPLDLTYTGKAMYALNDLVRSGVVRAGSKVVFWHTGGLLNLQSIRLFD